jgi:hypothetical protein
VIEKLILVVWLHFLADFILQTDKVAVNKSSSFWWLTVHAAVYSLPFFLIGWHYALINAGLHWCVDAVTSRIAKYFFTHNQRHWFFVVIGCDQAIHATCLILTLKKWG